MKRDSDGSGKDIQWQTLKNYLETTRIPAEAS